MKSIKRLSPEDVLEVDVPGDGLGYLLYLGNHDEYGGCILVSPQIYASRPSKFENVFQDGYVTFYPVKSALNKNFVRLVGRHKIPSGLPPNRLRRPGVLCDGRVESWIIEDEVGESIKYKLSDEELRIPIASIWNHEFLLDSIRSHWRPETEGSS